MNLEMRLADLRELHQYPDLLTLLNRAVAANTKPLELDLGALAYTDPMAMVECILYARTLGVDLLLKSSSEVPPQLS